MFWVLLGYFLPKIPDAQAWQGVYLYLVAHCASDTLIETLVEAVTELNQCLCK